MPEPPGRTVRPVARRRLSGENTVVHQLVATGEFERFYGFERLSAMHGQRGAHARQRNKFHQDSGVGVSGVRVKKALREGGISQIGLKDGEVWGIWVEVVRVGKCGAGCRGLSNGGLDLHLVHQRIIRDFWKVLSLRRLTGAAKELLGIAIPSHRCSLFRLKVDEVCAVPAVGVTSSPRGLSRECFPATNIVSAVVNTITEQTPAPGGSTSNALQFEVDSGASTSAPPAFTSLTATVTAGSTASYPVTLISTASNVTVICLNLPTGATCN